MMPPKGYKYKHSFWFRVRGKTAERRRKGNFKRISRKTMDLQYHEYHRARNQ